MLLFRNNKNVMERNDLKDTEVVGLLGSCTMYFFFYTSVSEEHTASFFRTERGGSGHGDWPITAMG
jgi:hypothetical protein